MATNLNLNRRDATGSGLPSLDVRLRNCNLAEVEDLHQFGEDCKGTSIFIANTVNFTTLEQFRQKVMENGEAIRSRLEHDSPCENNKPIKSDHPTAGKVLL